MRSRENPRILVFDSFEDKRLAKRLAKSEKDFREQCLFLSQGSGHANRIEALPPSEGAVTVAK